jgi:hypothetical protein
MNVEKIFLDQIEELKKQIAVIESALKAFRQSQRTSGKTDMRFYGMRPLYVARDILAKHNGRMERAKMLEIMVAGGITCGKKRGQHNLRISLDTNVKNGNPYSKR